MRRSAPRRLDTEMAAREMLMVFTYDVAENKRRRRVAKRLEDTMTRVQKSVFEARMSRRAADRLAKEVSGMIDAGDSLRVYAVGDAGYARSAVYGASVPFETPEGYWLI